MKVAVFSDIHSNYEAYRAVILDISNRGDVDELWCLGDVVGYGADVNACVRLTASLAGWRLPHDLDDELRAAISSQQGKLTKVVRGNHDAAVAGDPIIERFSELARTAALWTRREIADDCLHYLFNLPLTARIEEILLVHSSPEAPDEFPYILTFADATAAFRTADVDIVFYGHTHQPVALAWRDDKVSEVGFGRLPAVRCLVNVGSVGQPRDGDPRAAYAVFDNKNRSVEMVRVGYDVARAAEKIRRAGLPAALAQRLFQGW